MRLFSGADVCQLSRVTVRELDYWVRQGWVTPAQAARGSGSHRLFDLDGVVMLRAVSVLVHDLAVTPRRAIEIVAAGGVVSTRTLTVMVNLVVIRLDLLAELKEADEALEAQSQAFA